jgi:Flp pilus assembly protein TadD
MAKMRGDTTEAENLLRRAIAVDPREPSFHNNLGNLLRTRNSLAEAEVSYRRAVMLRPAYQEAHYNLGVTLEEMERTDDAIVAFRQALQLDPSDAQALTRIGAILNKHSAFDEALVELDRALATQPDNFDAHYYRGLVLSMLERYEDSKTALECAAALRPSSSDTVGNLALIAARRSDAVTARAYAARCFELDPAQHTAIIALAMLDLEEHNFTDAERQLRPLLENLRLDPNIRALVFGLLGDALEGQNRFAEAFASYTEKNEGFQRLNARYFGGKHTTEEIRCIVSYFETASAGPWTAPFGKQENSDQVTQHVFLLGFMRSGTTLLEQVLATHPAIVSLEERELLGDTAQVFLTSEAALNRLAVAEDDELNRYRNAYWKRVTDHGLDVNGKVFVDKQPLNTIKLPLIAKLFPDAKVLFALRDPRDVVFSCFRRHFGINATTYELLTLEGAARFYDAVMQVGNLCREILPLAIHLHRYEAMIKDFDAEVARICHFIGIEWVEDMRNFKDHPRVQSIRSLSAAQVRRGLYREGIGQWQRYVKELAPILPLLQPWVESFGYTAPEET